MFNDARWRMPVGSFQHQMTQPVDSAGVLLCCDIGVIVVGYITISVICSLLSNELMIQIQQTV